jgi:hypothetical protein
MSNALYVPAGGGDFGWQLDSTTIRPTAQMGAVVVAGSTANTMSGWQDIINGTDVIYDVYGISICFNASVSISAATRNMLFDIGVDNNDGFTYQVVIPHLLGGHASPYNIGSGGIWYYFPLFIPAGSKIAIRAQSNVGGSQTYVTMSLFGRPRRPETVRVGTKVFAFGVNTANSRGTIATLGTTSKSTYTLVGGPTTMRLWWWQLGYACVDTTMTAAAIHADVAAGSSTTNNKIVIQNTLITTTAAEQINNLPITSGCTSQVATGDNLYVRGFSSATPDTSPNFIVYGLGG